MEFKFINPFSEEFFKEKEVDDNLKLQNSTDDEDAIVIISYHRCQDDK